MKFLFDFEERQQRFTAFGPRLLRTVVEARCPFFDKQMLEFSGRLAPQLRSEEKPLFRQALAATVPELNRIPWQRTGLPISAGFLKTHLHLAAKYLRRQANDFLISHFGKSGRNPDNHRMVDYDGMIRSSASLRNYIVSSLIFEAETGSRFFNRRNVWIVIDRHLAGKGDHAEIIGRLLTVEIWHKLFVRGAAALKCGDDLPFHQRLGSKIEAWPAHSRPAAGALFYYTQRHAKTDKSK